MKKNNNLLVVFLSAVIFTALFYKKSIGLNLLVYETLLFLWLFISKQISFRSRNVLIFGIGFAITSLYTIITHSLYSYIVNYIALFIFIGVIIYPKAKSILSSLGLSFVNLYRSQVDFFKESTTLNIRGKSLGKHFGRITYFLIPLLIIILFVTIYRYSNPKFENLIFSIGDSIYQVFEFAFKDFDLILILIFLLGIFLSNFFLLRSTNQKVVAYDESSTDELRRLKNKKNNQFKVSHFKIEYRVGAFLLVVLNAILLTFNIIDIDSVWIHFNWEGQFLKQFVHEGTYLLIASILISIGIVLYFFRSNINFYSKNRLLKYLSYFWLFQNGLLVISVTIRNIYYINYFSLAYRRIGLAIFLLLTIYGLYTVYIKVKKIKSAFFLLKTNLFALYIALVLSSAINWDSLIAKYNFRHYDMSYLHLNFLATLSDKSLPYLDIQLPKLMEIDTIQKEKFPFIVDTMPPEEYNRIIENRKQDFIKKWQSKKLLSWNLPEYLAYKKLNQ